MHPVLERARGSVETVAMWTISPLRRLFTLNYYKIHMIYIIAVGMIGSLIIWGIEKDRYSYIDALFTAFSAISQTGLSTVDIHSLRGGSLATIIILVILGSGLLLTLPIPLIRQHYLRKAYREASPSQLARRHNSINNNNAAMMLDDEMQYGENEFELDGEGGEYDQHHQDSNNAANTLTDPAAAGKISNINMHINSSPGMHSVKQNPADIMYRRESVGSDVIGPEDMIDVMPEGAAQASSPNMEGGQAQSRDTSTSTITAGMTSRTGQVKPSAIRNRRFHLVVYENLEYRALMRVVYIVIGLYLFLAISSIFIMGLHLSVSQKGKTAMQDNDATPWSTAVFISICAIGNVGLTNLANNFMPFAKDYWMLIHVSFLIAVGNTAFPILLRLVVWAVSKVTRDPEPYYQLLDNPRLLYTHLFDASQTRALAGVWFAVTLAQFALFGWLDWKNHELVYLNGPDKFFNGIFLSISTRTGGFNSIDIPGLSLGLIVLLTVCMYLSAYPFIITLRGTSMNGEYSSMAEDGVGKQSKTIARDLLIREITWLYFAILVICIIEDADWNDTEGTRFSIFKVLFEVVSAYGTVGLSLGYPGAVFSFSGGLRPLSKLVIIILMLYGRHRGLPESVDSAVNLSEIAPQGSVLRKLGFVPRELITNDMLRRNSVFRRHHGDGDDLRFEHEHQQQRGPHNKASSSSSSSSRAYLNKQARRRQGASSGASPDIPSLPASPRLEGSPAAFAIGSPPRSPAVGRERFQTIDLGTPPPGGFLNEDFKIKREHSGSI